MTAHQEYAERWQGALMNNYGTPLLPLARGEGTRVWDADGTSYLDFVGGIATNALGHAHPAVVEAVTRQIGSLGHISNFFMAEPTVALAERLLRLFGRDGFDETAIDTCELYVQENGRSVNRSILTEACEDMGRSASAANFIEAIEGKAEPFNTPDQALKLMKIIDAIYQSAATKAPVAV